MRLPLFRFCSNPVVCPIAQILAVGWPLTQFGQGLGSLVSIRCNLAEHYTLDLYLRLQLATPRRM